MATVIYNGCAIIPAPPVRFEDEPIILGNQKRIGNTYRLTINGTLISYRGSPASAAYAGGSSSASWGGYNNQFWVDANYPPDESNSPHVLHQLYMIESKQSALRTLFATEGQWLEFQSADGSAPLKCQIKNVKVDFEQGNWFQECQYTITCEADVLYLNGQVYQGLPFTDLIQQAGENWELTPDNQFAKTFDVTHTVTAVGKRSFDSLGNETQSAWLSAKNFVYQQLALGWNSKSNFSALSGNYIFNNSALASGVLSLNGYKPYNYSLIENVDELAGSYQVTERWDLTPNESGLHVYTANTRRIVDDPYCNFVTQVQGTIHGNYDGLLNYDQRIPAAQYVWSQLGGPTGLLNLFNTSSLGYNVQPRQGEIDINPNEGTLTYNYEFSNQLFETDAFEQWTISKKVSSESYLTTFSIAGTIKGRRYDGDTDVKVAFSRANNWFTNISGNNYNLLYNRILSSTYWPEASGMGVQPDPISKSIDLNEGEGVISYSVEFNNRSNGTGFPADLATDEYQITKHFDRQDGVTHYTIVGTVKGLNVNDYNSQVNKFANASGYFYTYVVPNLYNRISTYYNVNLPDSSPVVTEVGTYPSQGEISYSYEFWSIFPPLLSGALSEKITVNEVNYNQQIQAVAKVPVPGRSQGPVIQDLGTTVEKARSITIEVVLPPTGDFGNLAVAFATKPNYDAYIYQLQPSNSKCTNWTDNYDWRYGRYAITAEFIYE